MDLGSQTDPRIVSTLEEPSALFSIVTVCLNPGLDLAVTISSILDQGFPNFEVIIKDGLSNDGTQAYACTDPRVRFHSVPDQGIYDAMNQALTFARGEYVCFLNAGDTFVDPDVLGDVAGFICRHSSVPFFYGDVIKALGRAQVNVYPERLTGFFLFSRTICHQSWFARRSLYLSSGGLETDHPSGADARLLLRWLRGNKVTYRHIPRTVANYKGGGVSSLPLNERVGEAWIDEQKRDLFSPWERCWYWVLWGTWRLVKPVLYDRCLCRVWRRMQVRRAQGNYRAFRRGQEQTGTVAALPPNS